MEDISKEYPSCVRALPNELKVLYVCDTEVIIVFFDSEVDSFRSYEGLLAESRQESNGVAWRNLDSRAREK